MTGQTQKLLLSLISPSLFRGGLGWGAFAVTIDTMLTVNVDYQLDADNPIDSRLLKREIGSNENTD